MRIRKIIKTILCVIIGIPTSVLLFYFGFIAFMNLKYPAPNCNNTNQIFENNPYYSKEYKTELIRLLKETKGEKTKFWFNEYIDTNHIAVTIQNDKICAKGHITVNKWEGFMKHLKKVEGKSYGGPLIGLKYSLIDENNNPEIILLSVRGIID